MICGSGDVLLPCNRKLCSQLASLRIAVRLEQVPGGHQWKAWNPWVEPGVEWLCRDDPDQARQAELAAQGGFAE